MEKDNIIYIHLNNWQVGYDCLPDVEIEKLYCYTYSHDDMHRLVDPLLTNKNFVRENNLIVSACIVDQSLNFCITATREWVEAYYPSLLTTYSKFLVDPNIAETEHDCEYNFRAYSRENIGTIRWYDEYTLNWLEEE